MKKFLVPLLGVCILLILYISGRLKNLKIILYTLIFTFNALCSYFDGSLVYIKNVPSLIQYPELPTGCEPTAATILLQYSGTTISKLDFASQLPTASMPNMLDTSPYSLHPNEAFIGNPFTYEGYGIYALPIFNLLQTYYPERVINLTNTSFDALLELIDKDIPVMVWVTMEMKPAYHTNTWQTSSGSYTWIAPEHTVVITGYDNTSIYTHDPMFGYCVYNKDVFIARWYSLGSQALAILPP